MMKRSGVVFLLALALAGCSGVPYGQSTASACAGGAEASYACQVERYHNVAQ